MFQVHTLTTRPQGMFMHLRHLTCTIFIFYDDSNTKNGIIQLAHCLNLAPQLETLHLDVSIVFLIWTIDYTCTSRFFLWNVHYDCLYQLICVMHDRWTTLSFLITVGIMASRQGRVAVLCTAMIT
jgi:hypothetical protein